MTQNPSSKEAFTKEHAQIIDSDTNNGHIIDSDTNNGHIIDSDTNNGQGYIVVRNGISKWVKRRPKITKDERLRALEEYITGKISILQFQQSMRLKISRAYSTIAEFRKSREYEDMLFRIWEEWTFRPSKALVTDLSWSTRYNALTKKLCIIQSMVNHGVEGAGVPVINIVLDKRSVSEVEVE